MKKNIVYLLYTIVLQTCIGQNLTADYTAFENLIKDVQRLVDSCQSHVSNDTTSLKTTTYHLKISLDSSGCICKVVINDGLRNDYIVSCLEHSLLSFNKRYDIYIDDYQYFKDKYWKLNKYATYYIRCEPDKHEKHGDIGRVVGRFQQ